MVCRDGMDFLPAALESLRAQSFTDWELVFWDNGSTDGSAEAVRPLGARARVGRSEESIPLGAARRAAIRMSRGSYLAFLDHDDLWRADKLERQVALLSRGDAGFVYSDCDLITSEGRRLGRYSRLTRPRSGWVHAALLEENFVPTVTAMLARAAYEDAGDFDPAYGVVADYEEWLRVSARTAFAYDTEPLGSYRVHRSGLTRDFRTAYAENERLYRELLDAARRGAPADDTPLRWALTLLMWKWALHEVLEKGGLREAITRVGLGVRSAGGPVRAIRLMPRFVSWLVRGLAVRRGLRRARR
jgi:glycosyltransferase involved in cell wall biosynthesis